MTVTARSVEALTPDEIGRRERQAALERRDARDARQAALREQRRVEDQHRVKIEKALPKRAADLDARFWEAFKQAVADCAEIVGRAQLEQEAGLPRVSAAPAQVTLERVMAQMHRSAGGGR